MPESDCEIVSSRGIMKSCNIYSSNPLSSIQKIIGYDFTKLKHGDLVYICGSALPDFIRNFFPNIKISFVLVTGDCDLTCPIDLFRNASDFIKFIESEKIIHWYSQNCIIGHPKITQIPIGMDYHTISLNDHDWGNMSSPQEQEKQLMELAKTARSDRIPMAYANFQFQMETRYGDDRKDAIKNLPKNCIYYEPKPIKRVDSWKKQSEYAFVISPRGNGLDCHRTWEALMLGCIPIVKTSPLNNLFSGLPIWIVEKWEDVTAESMNKKIEEYKCTKYNMEKLKLTYWTNKFYATPPFI